MPSQRGIDEATRARLLLVLLAFVWGLSWPITKIALEEVGVFTLRALGFSISAASLFAVIFLQGRSPSIPARCGLAAPVRRVGLQYHRVRPVQLVRPTRRHHLSRGHHQLLDAGLGQPDGVADSARAPDHDRQHRVGALHGRPCHADRARGDDTVGRRHAARARLRTLLGRRDNLHEMGTNPGRSARRHGVADRDRRRVLRCRPVHFPGGARALTDVRASNARDRL